MLNNVTFSSGDPMSRLGQSRVRCQRQMGVRWQCHIIGTVMFKRVFFNGAQQHSSNVNNLNASVGRKLRNSFAMLSGMIFDF